MKILRLFTDKFKKTSFLRLVRLHYEINVCHVNVCMKLNNMR